MAIDPDTYGKFLAAEVRAKQLGLPLTEVLDRAQLLLTEQRRHALQVSALEDLCRRFERQAANKLMSRYHRRVEGTSAEMFSAMGQWLEAVTRHFANKTLEDL